MSLKKLLSKQTPPDEYHPKRAKKHSEAHDESNWLVSYADMMTLLCGFFVMLYTMSKMDEPQYEKVKEEMSKQFGGDYTSPTKQLAKYVTQYLEEGGVAKDAAIRVDPSGVAVAFQSTVFFNTLSSELSPQGQLAMRKLVEAVASRQEAEKKSYRIVVEGHTDNRPVTAGPYSSNWELSSGRASRVVRMFLDRGFEASRLTAIGYADTYPEFPSRTPAGEWDENALGKNRRVVIRILEPYVDTIPYPDKNSR